MDDCVSKILEDNPELELDVALVWAISAKNAMQMIHGYSPYEFVFGANPNLPSTLIDKPPAFEGTTISEMFAKHLNALHAGRQAFVQAETSERIRKALRHQIRSLGEQFQTDDKVYYKRDNKWKGPGKVISQNTKKYHLLDMETFMSEYPSIVKFMLVKNLLSHKSMMLIFIIPHVIPLQRR